MNHPILLLLRTAWRYAKGRRPMFVAFISFSVIAHAVLLLEPYLIGRLLNAIQQGAPSNDALMRVIFKYLLLIFAIPFVFWAFNGVSRVWERTSAFYIEMHYKRRLLQQAFALPLSWHRNHHSGENIDKVNRASSALYAFTQGLFEPIGSITKLFGAYLALLLLMPFAGVVAILVSVVAVACVVLYDRVLIRQYRERYRLENRLASSVHDFLSNVMTVIAMRLPRLALQMVTKKFMNIFPVFRKNIVLNEVKWFSVSVIIALMVLLTLGGYVYATLAAGGVLLVGTLYSLYAYLERVSSAFYNFAWQYSELIEHASALQAAATISSAYRAHKRPATYRLPGNWREIRISDLYFTHVDEKRRRHHVESVELTLRRGARIALIGPSGGGKSTTMSLLRGIHHTNRATVHVDGKAMPHGLQHLYDSAALLPQEPELFAETIRYNLTLGRSVSADWLRNSLEMARFTPVLKRLHKGLQTNIAEKGVNLSGGEKQRLALARGLLLARKYPIILMDEPTSSVDTKNELAIYKSLFRAFSGKVIVASVHRLHLLQSFDMIYLIENGRVTEKGSLPQLLAKQGRLYRMWQAYFRTHKEVSPARSV